MKKENLLKGIQNTSNVLGESTVITIHGEDFYYDLKNFKSQNVRKDFMVRSLSKINRYDGHNLHKKGYSVAQHSVMMAQSALIAYGDPRLALQCLYHDLPEAYYGDITKPLKNALGEEFKKIEESIENIVFGVLGVDFPMDKRVKELDINIAQLEMSIMLSQNPNIYRSWEVWSPKKSERKFWEMETIIKTMLQYEK